MTKWKRFIIFFIKLLFTVSHLDIIYLLIILEEFFEALSDLSAAIVKRMNYGKLFGFGNNGDEYK